MSAKFGLVPSQNDTWCSLIVTLWGHHDVSKTATSSVNHLQLAGSIQGSRSAVTNVLVEFLIVSRLNTSIIHSKNAY